jgi:hypothetical protein
VLCALQGILPVKTLGGEVVRVAERVAAQTFDGCPSLHRARSSRWVVMGCSLRLSSPLVLSLWHHASIEGGSATSILAALVWGDAAAGGRGGSRAGQASFVAAACRRCGVVVRGCVTRQPRPSPTPGLAGLPSRSAIASLSVSPAAPPSESATARPLRGGAAASQRLHDDKPGLRLASCCGFAAAVLGLRPHAFMC